MITKRFLLTLLGLFWLSPALADRLYSDGFDPPVIEPLYPLIGGTYQLPPGPTTDQLAWILSELAVGETTTQAEVSAHFQSGYDPAVMSNFMSTLRSDFPNAVITDVVGVGPLEVTAVIDSPGGAAPHGFLVLHGKYTGSHLIQSFGVTNYYGSVQYPADQNLTLPQAANKFTTLSNAPALLVARIRPGMQCEVVEGRDQAQARGTASIFKIWVLGGVARAIAEGIVAIDETITLVASELAPGGSMNNEPLGTVFPLQDVMTLMMGISDNTATDLLHELVGRDWIEQIVNEFEHAQPQLLTPFLGISEQFHLFYSFPLNEALSYVNGSEAFQQQFLENEIEPLGSLVGDPYTYTNFGFLTTGTWQASPLDICKAFAHLRQLPQGSDAIFAVDQALGAQAAQPEVRGDWDRVWYKGGSLSESSGDYDVLTHAWMLENAGEDPWVVVAMSNSENGGINVYNVQSVTGRILELVDQMSP